MYTATFYSHIPHNFLSQYSMCITDKGRVMALKTPTAKSFHCVVVKVVLTISSGDLTVLYPAFIFQIDPTEARMIFALYLLHIYL